MMRSMTAFAGSEIEWEGFRIATEVRSVNHRFLDLSLRLPETLRGLEAELRSLIGKYAHRGRIECAITLKPPESSITNLEPNPPLIDALLKAAQTIENQAVQPLSSFSALELLRWPGVIHQPEINRTGLQEAAFGCCKQALESWVGEREREGLQLKELIASRCKLILLEQVKVQQRLPEVKEAIRNKILVRVSEISTTPNTDRLEQELVYLAQKMDITEELDRMGMHINEIIDALEKKEPVGRRLDFLSQELHREANTLGSKSSDMITTKCSIEMKVLIEQTREQVQNIE